MKHSDFRLALALTLIAIVAALVFVAWVGDGKVASAVDYTVPTTPLETSLEVVSGFLWALFIVAFAAGFIFKWKPSGVVTLVAVIFATGDGIVIFYFAQNLLWLLVDVVLLAVSLLGMEQLVVNTERRRRR